MAGEAIFIGYRHDDTADVAGRIYDVLEARFGRARLFKDVDDLRPGANFGEHIKTILPRCRVALILIGPNWVNATDEDGRRRLDDPNDWVRIEVEIALAVGDLDVVPVLVSGARLPRAEELPPSLRPLMRRHAATIRRDPDFRDDIARLAAALRASLGEGRKATPARPMRGAGRTLPLIGGAVTAAVMLMALGLGATRWLPPPVDQNAPEQTAATEPAARETSEQRERTLTLGSPPPLPPAETGAPQTEPQPPPQGPDTSIDYSLEPQPIRSEIANEPSIQFGPDASGREASISNPGTTTATLARPPDPQSLIGRWRVVGANCALNFPELTIRTASNARVEARQSMADSFSRMISGTYNYDVLEVREDRITYRRPDLYDRGRAFATLTWMYADNNILLVTNPEGRTPVTCTFVR